jgi:hypothetical protein
MKKLAIAVAAVASLSAGMSHAYTMGTFSNGFVVPNVIHDGGNASTAVGIISRVAGAVHWTFFDQNSNHVTDGCFAATKNDYTPFVWAAESGVGLANKRGYLVFTAVAGTGTVASTCASDKVFAAATTGGEISGHAFEYNLAAKDVSYIPVIDGPLVLSSAGAANVAALGPTDVVTVGGAASVGQSLYMRYYIDGAAGGDDTRIAVWSTGSQKGSHTVNMYDDKQGVKSVNFVLDYSELDFLDPETIVGRPSTFKDGFIVWNTTGEFRNEVSTTATTSGSVFSYSVISAPAFGAVQTILNPHLNSPV